MEPNFDLMQLNVTVAKRIKTARQAKFSTAKEAAKALGLPETTYAGYENSSRTPNFLAILKICKVFGITPNQLLGFSNDTDESTDNDNGTDVEDMELEVITKECLLNDEEYLHQKVVKTPSGKKIKLVFVESKKLGIYMIQLDDDYYKQLERFKRRTYKDFINSRIEEIRRAKTVEMNDSIEICRAFNFGMNITQENYYTYEKEINRFVIFQIFNYFLSPLIDTLSDEERERYSQKYFEHELYDEEISKKYGSVIPDVLRSPALERYFIRYYLFMPRRESMRIKDLGSEIEIYRNRYLDVTEPEISIYYQLQKEFLTLNPSMFEEKI